jgi:hypothetical protein
LESAYNVLNLLVDSGFNIFIIFDVLSLPEDIPPAVEALVFEPTSICLSRLGKFELDHFLLLFVFIKQGKRP